MQFNDSSMPRGVDLLLPALQSLSDGNEKTVDEILQQVIQILSLDPDILTIESRYRGKSQLKYVLEWSLNSLKQKGLITSPKLKYRIITEKGKDALTSGIDIASMPNVYSPDVKTIEDPIDNLTSFFDYIGNLGLRYDVVSVEDFLLSLKAKQFMILSGGTGTGKTKLAKAYGDFISKGKSKTIDLTITIGKGADNNGFTLSRDQFFGSLPSSANRIDGMYEFTVGGVDGRARIDLTPRFWFDRDDPNRQAVLERMKELKEVGDKTTISLKMPSLEPGSKNYVIVPVGSNWTDNRHIIGYRNAITGSYSGTPSLDLMIKSNRFITQPFLLILDEMNLSHVERYFSDIISCMESRESIILDTKGIEDIPDSIDLGDNLFVIGTVNMDETTYMFSPKVLDRANVLEFEPASVSDYLSSDIRDYEPTGDVDFLQDCLKGTECREMSAKEILDEICAVDGNTVFKDSIVSDLDSIQGIMSSMKLPFGFRTLDEVMRFMYVAWIYEGRGEFVNWKRYFDSQIKQKILPKIHGNSSISTPLRELGKLCADGGYNRSAAKIQKMSAVLESQRYVSFNC